MILKLKNLNLFKMALSTKVPIKSINKISKDVIKTDQKKTSTAKRIQHLQQFKIHDQFLFNIFFVLFI